MSFLNAATRYLFFAGKGGVGKTSIACAAAVTLADRGQRVLLVSTDPASNLDAVLGVPLSSHPTAIGVVPGLFALNIDPHVAAAAYRARLLSVYRGVVPAPEVATIEEKLAGACTMQIAAFDEFSRFLTEEDGAKDFTHILFDTAPTGHTLRLLQLPAAWTEFLERYTATALYTGPRLGLRAHQARYAAAVATLANAERTTLVLVTRPQPTALREAARTSVELASLGIHNQCLIVNGVFQTTLRDDAVAVAFEQRGQQALAAMPESLRLLPQTTVLLRGHNIVGIPALRELLAEQQRQALDMKTGAPVASLQVPPLADLIEELAALRHGLVMVMGKGGVGKTTIAAAIASELAGRGVPVHLTTTDPAAHLAMTLETALPGLKVSRIDPKAETETYRQRALTSAKSRVSAEEFAFIEEDLRSPCTEEIAVFLAFARIVASARQELVVMDTAPTGHTLLLLDATGAYHQDMVRKFGRKVVATPLMRLRDPAYTKILLVTLPEPTPVLEAAQLQADLRQAGIEPFAWVINASLAAAGTRDPVLVQRASAEREYIRIVQAQHAQRVVIVPWATEEPIGPERLRRLAQGG
ncbi:MAG: arsenical pump-driving ATPase [Deltaproteobacteria bacterium]|nr:arsenical pump-driving ATPase [Deltaproteobacteria bacterium]